MTTTGTLYSSISRESEDLALALLLESTFSISITLKNYSYVSSRLYLSGLLTTDWFFFSFFWLDNYFLDNVYFKLFVTFLVKFFLL